QFMVRHPRQRERLAASQRFEAPLSGRQSERPAADQEATEGRLMLVQRSALFAVLGSIAVLAQAQDKTIAFGAECPTPPPLHCPDSECAGTMVINQGPVVEMKTRRT